MDAPRRESRTPDPMRVKRVVRETPDIFSLVLEASDKPEGFAFAPGQFNMLYAFGVGEAAISVSGPPHSAGELVHTIREVGAVTKGLSLLRRGEALGVRGPFGVGWPLGEAHGRDVVIIAGGVGLAPLRSAIYALLEERNHFGRISLFYGARTPPDILYRVEMEEWQRRGVEVWLTVDRAEPGFGGRVGVVTSLIAQARLTPDSSLAFICGPEVMMRFAVRELLGLGMSRERVFLSLERSMRCGVGLCGHCQILPVFVCKDGPVFPYARVAPFFELREI